MKAKRLTFIALVALVVSPVAWATDPNAGFSQIVQDVANDLLGFVAIVLPPMMTVVAIIFGAMLLVGLFKWMVNHLAG